MPSPRETLFPSKKERHKERRKETRDRKLLDEFFDHPTLLAISRLVTQGQFLQLDYPISTGKEGGVFRATMEGGYRAVKVYRIGNAVLRRLPAYALEELKKTASEGNYARLIFAWTRREHTILRRLREAGIRSPETYGYLRNVLVMEFVGTEGLPAPKLRDAVVEDPEALYRALTDDLARMVETARLVHGDLSPYNVLYHEGTPVLIDVAQAIAVDHPQARELHVRDCTNFARYLEKLGVDTSPEEFFRRAGGEKLPNPEG